MAERLTRVLRHIERRLLEHDCSPEAERLFLSFLVLSVGCGGLALYGVVPPDPAVHWPGHKWIHFMKRLHVIMSIGCFIIEVCASSFSLFALHRVINGGFDTRARAASIMLVRELEYEYVAVCSYSFAGAWLLMGPVAIRSFCMVQQGLRSDYLAIAVCCLIVGTNLLVLSFFNANLAAFPYDNFYGLLRRFVELSLSRWQRERDGGHAAVLTVVAWALQVVSVVLSFASLVETFPWNFYRELDRQSALAHAAADSKNAAADHDLAPSPINGARDDESDQGSDVPLGHVAPIAHIGARGLPSGSGGAAGAPRAPTGTAPAAAQLWGFGTPAQIGSVYCSSSDLSSGGTRCSV